VDAFRLAQLAQISTVTGATAGELSGARINDILDQISWPPSMRDVDAGLTTMQADPGTNRTALQALSTVALSEYGALYVDASGSFVFQDREVTAGSIFHIVTYGINSMGSHANQLSKEERWQVADYVLKLKSELK
jgi:hypothetical protein